jgi:hypothetical protein
MTYGEYIDLVSYSKETWNNIATIMTILYRPVTFTHWSGKYDIQPYKGTDETMVDMFGDKLTMDIVFGAVGFFQHGLVALLKDIQHSTMQTLLAHKNSTVLKQVSQKNGISTEHLLASVQETLSTLTGPLK